MKKDKKCRDEQNFPLEQMKAYLKSIEKKVDSQTVVTVVIDTSGSMHGNEESVINMLKVIVEALVELELDIFIQVVYFDSEVHYKKPVRVQDFDFEYVAYGFTALYEAICETDKLLYDDEQGINACLNDEGYCTKNIIYFLTDGVNEYNTSRPYKEYYVSPEQAQAAIEHMQGKKAIIGFITFGQAAEEEASSLGIAKENIWYSANTTKEEFEKISKVVTQSCVTYSKTSSLTQTNTKAFITNDDKKDYDKDNKKAVKASINKVVKQSSAVVKSDFFKNY